MPLHEEGSADRQNTNAPLRGGFRWKAEHSGPSKRWVQMEGRTRTPLYEVGSDGRQNTLVPPRGGFRWKTEHSGPSKRWVQMEGRTLWSLQEVGSDGRQNTLVPPRGGFAGRGSMEHLGFSTRGLSWGAGYSCSFYKVGGASLDPP